MRDAPTNSVDNRMRGLAPAALLLLLAASHSKASIGATGILLFAGVAQASDTTAPRLAIASIAGLPQPLPSPYIPNANADQQVANAKARASATGKKLLIELGSNWCSDSRALAAVLEMPQVRSFIAQHYEVVLVDVNHRDRNLQIPGHYGVMKLNGIPTPLIIDPKTDRLLNADHLSELVSAADMTPQAIVDWFAHWA